MNHKLGRTIGSFASIFTEQEAIKERLHRTSKKKARQEKTAKLVQSILEGKK